MSAPAGSWLVRARPRTGARLRLFCVPHAGVGPSAYRRWTDSLPPEIDVAPVRLPGRESRLREAPYRQIDPLVAAAASALGPYLDIPYAMFGHSMGAMVAFELARRFEMEDQGAPRHLFVSGRRAPRCPRGDPPSRTCPTTSSCGKSAADTMEFRTRFCGIRTSSRCSCRVSGRI